MIEGLVKAKRAYFIHYNKIVDYELIKELHESDKKWDISFMCKHLNLSRSAYYKWLNSTPTTKQLQDERILIKIKEVAASNNSLFGAMNMYYTLKNKHHFTCGITESIELCVSTILNLLIEGHQATLT